METFDSNNSSLSSELMDMLARQVSEDPFYQECAGTRLDNNPQYLQTLKNTLHVRDSERILFYAETGMIFRGKTGMIVTENGVYYKGIMELPKFITWADLLGSPINILCDSGTALTLRVKVGLMHKPFAPVLGGNHGQDDAEFWVRIKQTIIDYYHLDDGSEPEFEDHAYVAPEAHPATPPKAPAAPASPYMSSLDELKKLKELLDLGAVTKEEYDAKKKQLLGL